MELPLISHHRGGRMASQLLLCSQATGAAFALRFASPEQATALRRLVVPEQQQHAPAAGGDAAARDEFSRKTDEASADIYFKYYGMLQHQQNMLQDYIRTGRGADGDPQLGKGAGFPIACGRYCV